MHTLLLLLLSEASASQLYYPNESDTLVEMPSSFALSGHLIVAFKTPQEVPKHPALIHWKWLREDASIALIQLRPGTDDLAISRHFHNQDNVKWAHPDFLLDLKLHAMSNDPLVDPQWHLENEGQKGAPGVDVNAELAWTVTTGEGQLIAIIDSGVDLTHPDLLGTSGYDYVDQDEDSYPADGNAHGTACAGLAAGIGNNEEGGAGVAYGAEILGVRLLGGPTTMSDMYGAIVNSVDAGASVLSNSWGFSGSCQGYSIPEAYEQALDYAEEKGRDGLGTVVLQAAGNDNCDISNDGLLAYPTIVAVAALGASDDKESYSSFGTPIDIAAPSGGLITTDITGEAGYGSYAENNNYTGGMSGTSAATPVAAGVYALMFAANERLTAAQARDIVCQTATRNDILDAEFDDSGWSPYFGCGRIDAGAAVMAVANVAPEVPESAMSVTEVYEDRIWLDWSAAIDLDGDPLTYKIQWWTNEDESEAQEQLLSVQSLDVTDSAQAGDLLYWRIQAIDLWGAGEWSETYALDVVARPLPAEPEAPQAACQSSPRFAMWWLGLLVFWRKQRTESPTPVNADAR